MAAGDLVKHVRTHESNQTNATQLITLASGETAAVGNTVVCTLGWASSGTLTGIVDSKGNTWQIDKQDNEATTNTHVGVASAYITTALAAADTITLSFSASTTARALEFNEFEGILQSSSLDVSSSGNGNSTSPDTGATAATAASVELVIAAFCWRGVDASLFTGPGAPFTALTRSGYDSGTSTTSRQIAPYYKKTGAAGAQQATATITSQAWAAAIVAYKLDIVSDTPPVADAGADIVADGGETVTVDCSGSSDVEGALTYDLDVTSGTAADLEITGTGPTFQVKTKNTAAAYTLTLTVTDSALQTDTDTMTITTTQTPLLMKLADGRKVKVELRWKSGDAVVTEIKVPVLPSSGVFVDPINGLDTNDGSLNAPFASLLKAVRVAEDGADVWLKTGVYAMGPLTSVAATSRTDFCRVQPYPGATVTMNGAWTFGRSSTNNGIPQVSYVELYNLTLTEMVKFGWGSSNMAIRNCLRTGVGTGVFVEDGCHDIWIEDNEILMGDALYTTAIFCSGVIAANEPTKLIERLYIRRNRITADQVGMNIRGFKDVWIEDNDVSGMVLHDQAHHTDGIRTWGGGENIYVRRNVLHDAQAIMLFHKDGRVYNAVYENNLVYNISGGFVPVEFYATTGLVFVNNTVEGSVLFLPSAGEITGIVCANNIVGGQLNRSGSGTVTFDYKDYNVIGTTNTSPGANDVIGNVLFEDQAGDDFHLDAADTLAKDTGTPGTAGVISGFELATTDLEGTTRSGTWDRGCYVA